MLRRAMALLMVMGGGILSAGQVVVEADPNQPRLAFAADRIRQALIDKEIVGPPAMIRLHVAPPRESEPVPQSYVIRRDERGYEVTGDDSLGAMYGGLELAERIRLAGALPELAEPVRGRPSILRRGLKFNIPLDARTPSYDDSGDAAQKNIAEMWNFAFWQEFLDAMADHRYNTLTLWNPHPFPSMVKVPEYPDCALDDVARCKLNPVASPVVWEEPMGVNRVVLDNLEVIKKMSIEEKIAFWRRVMQYAHNRGIEIYIITWNVLVNGTDGKYGITWDQDNPVTIDYIRASTRELILTYPLLAGIGATAGEHMFSWDNEYSREKWLWKSYGRGVEDAKKVQPDRTVKFIHRVWNTDMENILREFGRKYPDDFTLSFKYLRARLYSDPKPVFADALIRDLRKYDLTCWWNLRNDDIFHYRWGDPAYVRALLGNLPADVTAGFHMGSDGYVWGREFASMHPQTPRQLEIDKHWYRFLLWGRLGYDLELPRERIVHLLADHFAGVDPETLYDTWAAASRIIPEVNRFYWRNWDAMWSVEGCINKNSFRSVRDFIDEQTMPGTDLLTIPQYVERKVQGQPTEGTTPPQVVAALREHARRTREGLAELRRNSAAAEGELRRTLEDLEAMALLGEYYASKIDGATQLHLFEVTGDEIHQQRAVEILERAVGQWHKYALKATTLYRPQLLARTQRMDWLDFIDEVRRDVDMAKEARPPAPAAAR